LIIATPPINLDKRSCNFSTSYGELDLSICDFNSKIRASITLTSPLPSTIVVVSLPTVIVLASPNQSLLNLSKRIPFCCDTTVPPVNVAISSRISVLRSPKSGALTAATFKIPLILLTISVASASPSISSATINKDLFCVDTDSRIGNRSFTAEILPSTISNSGLSSTAVIVLLSVTI